MVLLITAPHLIVCVFKKDNEWHLVTISNVLPGEELTLTYSMYNPEMEDEKS